MSVDSAGKLHGLRLAAPAGLTSWLPPAYANPQVFAEQEVTLAPGSLAVGGTLTLPHTRGPLPGVALLSGGGPFDRDETSGLNKPLKDLAWGLAGRGIAVLRFDKVTFAHGAETAARPDFTATDEYVPFAVAATRILQRQAAVDPARVFILGHSMGGRMAPRVALAEPSVAGLVILAGMPGPCHRRPCASPTTWPAASRPPGAGGGGNARPASRAGRRSPAVGGDSGPRPLFGWSGAYWLDLRGYDPVATAAALDKPMLILQGGRDYQVTVAQDLARWRAVLGGRPRVTIRTYEADNHLFFSGTGPSGPEEYEAAQHVDPAGSAILPSGCWQPERRARLATRPAAGSRNGGATTAPFWQASRPGRLEAA